MGEATSHLPVWTGAPRHSSYPSLWRPTLASGYSLKVIPLYQCGGRAIEGTVDRVEVLDAQGNPVTYFGAPGDVITAAHSLPTRDQLRYMMALCKFLGWLRQPGYYGNETIKYNGTNENLRSLGPFEIVSASGRQVTIDSDTYDFRHLSLANQVGVIGPLDQVVFSDNCVLSQQVTACVKRVVDYGTGAGSNVTLELFQTVDAATETDDGNPATLTIQYEYYPEPWPLVRDLNPLYAYWETMTVSYAEAEDGLIELERAHDGSHGRIAHPRVESDEGGGRYKEATVVVIKTGTDLTKTDLTASTLSRWNSTVTSGVVISTFDASGLLSAGESLTLRWRMERDSSIPYRVCDVVGSDRCLYAQRDATDTHDYCAKARTGGGPSGLDEFIPACYQWDCDGYAQDQPFDFADLDDWFAHLWLAVPFAEEQVTPVGVIPVTYHLHRMSGHGLRYLLGGPAPTADSDGQAEISHPTRGMWGSGAFYPVEAKASDYPLATDERTGLASDGANGTDAYGDSWVSLRDPAFAHRSLLRSQRMRTTTINQTSDSFAGRSMGDRVVIIEGHVTAATMCEHNEDDEETNHSGQVAFQSNADGSVTLTVQQLGERGNLTITTGEVAAAARVTAAQTYIEPANKPTTINFLDAGQTPPLASSGTINLGAAGAGVVRGHEANQIWDADSGLGVGGTVLAGAIPSDWVRFTNVSGDDADAIEATAYLIERCDPFGGGTEDYNWNGSPGDPPVYWTRPPNFDSWAKRRSRIYLRDHNGLLGDNAANLVAADITVISGGVLAAVNEVRNNDTVLDPSDYTVEPFSGVITIDASATVADGYYRLDVDAIDTTAPPQADAFTESVEAIEVCTETELVPISLDGVSEQIEVLYRSRHPEEWQDSAAVIETRLLDDAYDFMQAASDPTYTQNEARYFMAGGGAIPRSIGPPYAECPVSGQADTWTRIGATEALGESSVWPAGTFEDANGNEVTTVEARGGAGVGEQDGPRRWVREMLRRVTAAQAIPGGILRALPDGATILEATIDVTLAAPEASAPFTGPLIETTITANKTGYVAGSSGETADTTTTVRNRTDSLSLELWATMATRERFFVAGVGSVSFDASTGQREYTETIDFTAALQHYLDSMRGRHPFVNLFIMPGVAGTTDFTNVWFPTRTGTKAAEYTGCTTDPSDPSLRIPVQQDTAILAENDYTDTTIKLQLYGFDLSNCRIRFELPEEMRALRLPCNATGALRDLINP